MNLESSPDIVRHNQDLFKWCLLGAQECIRNEHYIKAARWCETASIVADIGETGALASKKLEELLLKISNEVPITPSPETLQLDSNNERWLHVLTKAFPVGGHTALVARWIESDNSNTSHSVVLTDQLTLDTPNLQQAISNSGGQTYSVAKEHSPLLRAAALRNLANNADVVVLHIHMADIVPALAFGVPGKTPVLLLNHADHAFWVGNGVVDMVLNIRPASEHLTKTYRGLSKTFLLPIPLDGDIPPEPRTVNKVNLRKKIRHKLGIPQAARVFLTIGSEYKYEPSNGFDFPRTALEIISRAPDAYIVAVGPSPDNPAWAQASIKSNGRIIAVGIKQDLAPYHAIADVYGEGFPFGSLTALLEAGLSGLPCVLAPITVSPIFFSSDLSTQELVHSHNIDEYINIASKLLAMNQGGLKQLGSEIASQIRRHHCGSKWLSLLDNLHREIPKEHQINLMKETPSLPPQYIEHSLKVTPRHNRKEIRSLIEIRAQTFGLTLPDCYGLYIDSSNITKPCTLYNSIRLKAHQRISSLTGCIMNLFIKKTNKK